MSDIFLGIDLGGTNIKIGCFDSDLNILCKTSVSTEAEKGPSATIEKIGMAVEKMLAEIGLSSDAVKAVGMGTPGQLDLKEGIIVTSPNMTQFNNCPMRGLLEEKFGKPTVLENDANSACWGEFVCGAGRGISDMTFFTLGTGIGGGVVIDGQLFHGANYNGAELGHRIVHPDGRLCSCGQRGCVEAYSSATATVKRAKEALEKGATESSLKKLMKEKGGITCKDIYEHAAAGDELALEITDITAKMLAITSVNMLHVTDPQRIVFSGGMIAAGDILLKAIKKHFNEQLWTIKKETVEICFATLGEDTGIIGAAALAQQLVGKG